MFLNLNGMSCLALSALPEAPALRVPAMTFCQAGSAVHTRPMLRQSGFSLVELMVAMTLGLIILLALSGIFVTSSRGRSEIERVSQQIEYGRYAIQLLTEDLTQAGYLGELNPNLLASPTYNAANPPVDPCSTDLPSLRSAIVLHVQGYDNGTRMPTCLSDVAANTDIVVIRRASTCIAGSTDCAATSVAATYFQAALCGSGAKGATQLNSSSPMDFFALDTDVAKLTKNNKDCTTLAPIRRYRTHIYYVANNDQPGDGIPTLKRLELGAGGFTAVPLVEGIENLQIEYGINTAVPTTGSPDVFTADPNTYLGCAPAACISLWRNVVAARVYLLARNPEKTNGYTDDKSYTLGKKADGTANVVTVATANAAYKRHVYQTEVRLNNPAGRALIPIP